MEQPPICSHGHPCGTSGAGGGGGGVQRGSDQHQVSSMSIRGNLQNGIQTTQSWQFLPEARPRPWGAARSRCGPHVGVILTSYGHGLMGLH